MQKFTFRIEKHITKYSFIKEGLGLNVCKPLSQEKRESFRNIDPGMEEG